MKNGILFFIALFCLSQSASLVRLSEAPPSVVGFWRLLAAALIMFGFQRYQTLRQSKPFWSSCSSNDIWATGLSGVFFFGHLWSFFIAAQNTSIANCMVLFSTNPLFTALGAWLLMKEPFIGHHRWSFGLAFTGIGILFFDRLNFSILRSGDFSALLSAIFFAGYILAGKKARKALPTTQYSWIVYLMTSILFGVVGLFQNTNWIQYQTKTWLAIAGTVIFPTLLGHALISHLLPRFNINVLSCGKLSEPLMSAIVAFFIFGETLSQRTLVAFGFTLSSGIVLMLPFIKKTLNKN